MGTLVADEYDSIAQRMREIAAEKRRSPAADDSAGSAGAGRYGIWFDPGDRVAGWCRIGVGKWGIFRPGDVKGPTLFETTGAAQQAIDNKGGGSWDPGDMSVREYR